MYKALTTLSHVIYFPDFIITILFGGFSKEFYTFIIIMFSLFVYLFNCYYLILEGSVENLVTHFCKVFSYYYCTGFCFEITA